VVNITLTDEEKSITFFNNPYGTSDSVTLLEYNGNQPGKETHRLLNNGRNTWLLNVEHRRWLCGILEKGNRLSLRSLCSRRSFFRHAAAAAAEIHRGPFPASPSHRSWWLTE
jgi:hypothetical protein